MPRNKRWIAILGALAASTALALPAVAQSYPTKPIRAIVSIAAGSVTDVIMRAAANELAPRLGQSLIIENNGGAAGILAAQQCAGASADGHTICIVYHSQFSFNPHLFNKLPYDPDKDFDLVARLFFLIEGIAVSNASGVNSIAELKAAIAAKPAGFNFGTLGNGSSPDLFRVWLNNQWGTAIPGVPFRGGGPVAQALASGDIQVGKMGVGNFRALAEGDKLKLIAVEAPRRLAIFPNVPTSNEAGLDGYKFIGWWGLATPRGVPAAAVQRLNSEFVKLFSEPKFVAFLDGQSVRAAPTSPEAFNAFVREDRQTGAALIKMAQTPRADYKAPEPAKK